jgi:UDPglucose--hexose-1-phosphate uridylyltransferase
MPEFRQDPVTGHRVIIAPERALRPDEFSGPTSGPCVFCPGREADTPEEVDRLSAPGGGWRARVIPNKYPALDLASGGRHEVVIESARHETRFAALTDEEVADVLGLWRERLRALRGAGRFHRAAVFKNEGPAAGASIEHVHSQILAVGGGEREAPPRPVACPLCADVDAARAVAARDGLEARVPFAPRFPDEVRIAPSAHRGRFEDEDDGGLRVLAGLLRDVLGRLGALLGRFPYNLALHTAPWAPPADDHWRLEILPRTTRPGGYEWGTGTFINPASPEASARRLRETRA